MRQTACGLLLAAACAGGAAAQEVSTELYGEFRYSYNRADAGDSTHWASANNASRLGVRGEVKGTGVTAFFDLQTGVNVDVEGAGGGVFTQRYYLAGVRGAFGTLTVGRHTTAYKAAGLRVDPFFDTSTLSTAGGVPVTGLFAGGSFGMSNLVNGFADRAIAYASPALAGVTLNAAAYLDTDSEHDFALGAGYRAHGIDAGAQYYGVEGGRTWPQAAGVDHALRLHAAYARAGRWSLGASFERLEADSTGAGQDFVYAAGTLDLTRRIRVAGAVGHVEEGGAVQPVTGTAWHAGVFYALFPQARVHALYSRLDRDDGPGRGNVALGLTYQFTLKP